MVGIYKITSPSSRAYIGQSWNIKRRWHSHRCNSHKTMAVGHSIKKYGADAHKFEVIHELPGDIDQLTLDTYEQLYIDAYKDCGVKLFNIKGAGSSGKHSDETLQVMSEKRKSYRPTLETKLKTSQSMKGMVANNKGVPHTEEHRLKISLANKGRKPSEKSINALIERNKKRTGFTPWNKGKEWSEEAKIKMSNAHKGKKLSKESIEKRTLTRFGKLKGQ